ncbi:hypothetical protein KR038_000301, partial [Drosophila bunnanda]
ETEDLCAFCLDRIQDPEKLHCNHAFCKSCLEIYLEARNWVAELCPICRRSLGELTMFPRMLSSSSCDLPLKGWRLFGFMTLLMMLLSLGPFYLLLIYW